MIQSFSLGIVHNYINLYSKVPMRPVSVLIWLNFKSVLFGINNWSTPRLNPLLTNNNMSHRLTFKVACKCLLRSSRETLSLLRLMLTPKSLRIYSRIDPVLSLLIVNHHYCYLFLSWLCDVWCVEFYCYLMLLHRHLVAVFYIVAYKRE